MTTRLLGALGIALPLLVGTGATALAGPPVSFSIALGDCDIQGKSIVSPFRLIVRDAAGHVKAKVDVTTDGEGDWSTPCLPLRIRSGDRLIARQGDTVLRSFTVPPFGMRLDRATDEIGLSGPPNAELHFVLDACLPPGRDPVTCYGQAIDATFVTDGQGGFQADLGGPPYDQDVVGGDRVGLEWTSPAGDFVQRRETVWFMEVEAGRSKAVGMGRPGRSLVVTLRTAGGDLRGRGRSTTSVPAGTWDATFRRDGSKVPVRVGNRVIGDFASDATLRVRDISFDVDLFADTASGTCYPNGRYALRIYDSNGSQQGSRWGTADGSGLWDEGALSMLESGWRLRLWCATGRGDAVRRVQTIE